MRRGELVVGEDDVARLPRDGYGARKTNPGCRHVAPFEGMDAVIPEMPLELQVRAGPNSKVSAQGLIRVAQHDAEQKREPIHDTVVRNAVVRRVVAVQVWSIERAGRSFGPWKAQGDLALLGPLHAAIPDQRAHIRPGPRVRRKAKQPRVLHELFAKRLSVHACDIALVDTSPQRMIDGAPGAADETCRNRRRYVQESLLHEEPLLGIGERICRP